MNDPIEIRLRNCGSVGWLPIIVTACSHERELYRGEHKLSPFAAFGRAMEVYENEETGDIKDFRASLRKKGLIR